MAYGYKVVYRDMEGELTSAYLQGKICYYEVNKPTVPCRGDGPLAVFLCKADARRFARQGRYLVIYRCHYIPTKGRKDFWAGEKHLNIPPPDGTDYADEVILLRQVS